MGAGVSLAGCGIDIILAWSHRSLLLRSLVGPGYGLDNGPPDGRGEQEHDGGDEHCHPKRRQHEDHKH